jgi:leucyl aminopeptidase
MRSGVPLAVVSRVETGDGGPRFGPGATQLTEEWLALAEITGQAGEVHRGPPGSAVHWLVGIGDGTQPQWRTAGAGLVRAVNASAASESDAGRRLARSVQLLLPPESGGAEVAELVRGLCLGGYRFMVSSTPAKPRLRAIRLVVAHPDRHAEVEAAASRAVTLAGATALARDLANMPSNIKDPAWLARTAAKLAGQVPGAEVTVRDEAWLAEHGFGGVLAVGGGSIRPPRLIELSWRPPAGRSPHLVLIGKGVTFDTGGISVKPADGMHLMRTDMAGGAAVIAAFLAVTRMRLGIRLTALVPCAENHLSGSAYRPGDVVRHFGGRMTEVINTDAEGRLLLADVLGYAAKQLRPDLVVDVATLTGAMKVALGLRIGGLFANNDELAARLMAAGGQAGESWWRMPLPANVESVAIEFADVVRSDIADLRQCPPGPGGLAAAAFLQEFTDGLRWAHLDIAGPARAEKTYDDIVPGATGFGARTLIELAISYAGRV